MSILKSIRNLEGNPGIFSFEAMTELKMLKKSRDTKEPLPEKLKGAKKIIETTVSLGNDYETAVNNRLRKSGKDADFKAESTYCEPIRGSKLLYAHKESGQIYLRVYPNLCKAFHTTITYIDAEGRVYTPAEFKAEFAEFMPAPRKEGANQGLEDPVMVRNYKIENILRLRRGEFEYSSAAGA